MIEMYDVAKHFGRVQAVAGLTATVPPGAVTAFVGPNGAGKTTTMRLIAGLDRPTRGQVRVAGRALRDVPVPLRTLGVVFDGRAALGSRRSLDHLRWIAEANQLPRARVDHTLRLCGIDSVGRRRAGTLSLGMYQRLALAAALLGDPTVLVLDEPTNGLDPEGMVWMRQLLRRLADDGRTVFVSSHLMGELAHVADRALVIGRGTVLADCALSDLPRQAGLAPGVRARSADAAGLAAVLGPSALLVDPATVHVVDLGTAQVAAAAATNGITLTELTPVTPTLEEAYLALTEPVTQYRARAATAVTR